jgi:hypothetical protein
MEDQIKEQVDASIGVGGLIRTLTESARQEDNPDYVFAMTLASYCDEPPGTLVGCRCADVTQLEHLGGTIDDRCYRVFF